MGSLLPPQRAERQRTCAESQQPRRRSSGSSAGLNAEGASRCPVRPAGNSSLWADILRTLLVLTLFAMVQGSERCPSVRCESRVDPKGVDMARKPPGVAPPTLEPSGVSSKHEELEHTVTLSTITPMFGGAPQPTKVNLTQPVTARTVRGHLRFWWRAINGGRFSSIPQLFQAESRIWGSAASDHGSPLQGGHHGGAAAPRSTTA